MNEVLTQIKSWANESVKEELLIDSKLLEENGKIYYMNDIDGTVFDWKVNGRLCEFMQFYKDSRMGAVKINIYKNGEVKIYLYKDNVKAPFKNISKNIEPKCAYELAVLMNIIADNKKLWGKAIEDMNSDIAISAENKNEFEKNF